MRPSLLRPSDSDNDNIVYLISNEILPVLPIR